MTINTWGTFLTKIDASFAVSTTAPVGSVNGLRLISKPIPQLDADDNDMDATMFHGQFGPADEGKPGTISLTTDIEFNLRPEDSNNGTTATGPNWDPIMRSASFARASSGSGGTGRVQYTPVVTSQESCTMQINTGGTIKQMLRAAVSESITFTGATGKPIIASASMRSLFELRTDEAADPNVEDAYHNSRYPIMTSGTLTIDGKTQTTLLVSEFVVSIENVISKILSLAATYGIHSFRVSDQKIMVTCKFNAVSVATYLSLTNYLAGTQFAWNLVIGSTNNQIKFSGFGKHMAPNIAEDEGRLVENLNIVCVPSSGNLNDHFKVELGTPA